MGHVGLATICNKISLSPTMTKTEIKNLVYNGIIKINENDKAHTIIKCKLN